MEKNQKTELLEKKTRKELKNFFLKGRIPSQDQFHNFIDSTINLLDDGMYYKSDEGFRMQQGSNSRVFSFYKNLEDEYPDWFIATTGEDNEGLNIGEPQRSANGLNKDTSRLFIETGGKVGIGTTKPQHALQVEGTVAMNGRIGNYLVGEDKPANGEWQDLIIGEDGKGLTGYNAYEIIATTDVKNNNYAITFATAVTSLNRYWFLGRAKRGIKHTYGYFSRWRNKIEFRWQGTPANYRLQVRTRRNFGAGVFIRYNVSKLL